MTDPLDTPVYVAPSNAIRGLHAPGVRPPYCINPKNPCKALLHTADWRAPLGSDANTHQVKALLERTPLRAVLATVYRTEAHVGAYAIVKDGVPLARQPRVRKDALAWLRAEGFEVMLTCFMADWDTPGHAPWTPETLAAFDALWGSARGPLATCGLYLSPKGARLVQPVTRWMPVEEGEASLGTWLDELVLAGVDPTVTAVHDWTRLMRTPHHRRDSGTQVRSPRIDLSRLVAIDPPPPKYAPRTPVRRPTTPRPRKPGDADVRVLWTDAVPAGWESIADALGASIRDHVRGGQYRRCYLALAGALCGRGCPVEGVPAVVGRAHAVDRSYPEWEALLGDRIEIARTTAARWINGETCLGEAVLREEYPRVADALDAVTLSPVEARVRRQLAAPAPRPVPVAEATAKIRDEIRDAYGPTLIAAPPGTGKTHEVVEHARHLPVIGERAAPGSRLAMSAPRHDLAKQTAAKLSDRALHLFSPPSMVDPRTGEPVCLYVQAALSLANGRQSVRRELCEGRGKHPCDLVATCPAGMGKEGADNANLVVGVHGLVRELRAYAGTRGVLVVDEPGEVTVVDRVTLDDLETARRHLDAFVPRYARAILPALVAFTAWVREAGALDGPLVSVQNTIRASVNAVPEEDLAAAEIDPETVAADLGDAILVAAAGAIRDDARSKAPPLEWRSIALAKVNAARAAELGQASRLLDLLWRAITSPVLFGARLDDRGGERAASVVSINDDFLLALRHEGPVVVLDANAALHAPAITRVLGYAPKLVEIAVADGAPIERTIFATGNATRSSWLPRGVPDWEAGILAALRAAVGWMMRDVATRKVGFIAPLVIETAVAATLRPDDAKVRARWPHSKKALDAAREILKPILAGFNGEFLTGHYGALEGLDFMAGCDATVTFMDPRPNLGDEELRAEFLGLDPSGRLDQLAAAELQQAHGRLRTIHRTRPGRQLHVGGVVPAGWAGLDVRVEGLRVGRPRNVAAMSPEEFRAARDSTGLSQAAFARSIRCGLSAVKHYEQGRAPVPEDVACAVRAIMSDGSETPREKVS